MVSEVFACLKRETIHATGETGKDNYNRYIDCSHINNFWETIQFTGKREKNRI